MARTRTTRPGRQQQIRFAAFYQEKGQEIAEAAVVMPILCLVLLAIFWFGRVFNMPQLSRGPPSTAFKLRIEPVRRVVTTRPPMRRSSLTLTPLCRTHIRARHT